jgi:hypothetical protein
MKLATALYSPILFLLMSLSAGVSHAEELAATPYRPSVSAPAALSAPGWLEVELGGQQLKDAGAKRGSVPYTLKLAFTPDWGIRIGGEANVRARAADGSSASGVGDTTFIAKYRMVSSETSAYGIEAGFKKPTASNQIGSGKSDTLLNFIYSVDDGKWHLDANISPTKLGLVEANQSRWQTGWAAALSRSLDDKWGIVGELSGTRQGGAASTKQFLAALSYASTKRMVFDVGVAKGLTDCTTDKSLFFGVTYLATPVF